MGCWTELALFFHFRPSEIYMVYELAEPIKVSLHSVPDQEKAGHWPWRKQREHGQCKRPRLGDLWMLGFGDVCDHWLLGMFQPEIAAQYTYALLLTSPDSAQVFGKVFEIARVISILSCTYAISLGQQGPAITATYLTEREKLFQPWCDSGWNELITGTPDSRSEGFLIFLQSSFWTQRSRLQVPSAQFCAQPPLRQETAQQAAPGGAMLHNVSKGVVYSGRHSLTQIRDRVGDPQTLQSLTLEPCPHWVQGLITGRKAEESFGI